MKMTRTWHTWGAAAAAVIALAASALHAADNGAARLRSAALAEEGDLLLEEMAALAPLRARERAEGERLAATEKKLGVDVGRVEKQVADYNRAVTELNVTAAEHAQACPGTISGPALAQCTDRGAKLMDRAAELDRQRAALDQDQKEINARVDQHNRAREAWLAARRSSAPKLDANAADVQRWVSSARHFMATADFAALRDEAGKPAACTQLRLSDSSGLFGERGLKQLHACLKAVLASTRQG
jgi:hypothetical protein